jgi:hypothetical protein
MKPYLTALDWFLLAAAIAIVLVMLMNWGG